LRCFSEPCGDVGISDHALDELGEHLVHDPLEVVDGREDPAAVLGLDTAGKDYFVRASPRDVEELSAEVTKAGWRRAVSAVRVTAGTAQECLYTGRPL